MQYRNFIIPTEFTTIKICSTPLEIRAHLVETKDKKWTRTKCAGKHCPICSKGNEVRFRYCTFVLERFQEEPEIKILDCPLVLSRQFYDIYLRSDETSMMNLDFNIKRNPDVYNPFSLYKKNHSDYSEKELKQMIHMTTEALIEYCKPASIEQVQKFCDKYMN